MISQSHLFVTKLNILYIKICNNISQKPKVFQKNADIYITKGKQKKGQGYGIKCINGLFIPIGKS